MDSANAHVDSESNMGVADDETSVESLALTFDEDSNEEDNTIPSSK